MEEKGIIVRYTVDIDPSRFGYHKALIGLDTKSELKFKVLDRIKQMKEAVWISTSHGDHDIMLEGWFKDHKELNLFVEELEKFKEITKVCPAVLLETIKSGTAIETLIEQENLLNKTGILSG